nr:3-isopropylmalate dehydratase small subunit [Archangium violaceum]
MVTGANLGCGSSREHAVWALDDFGIRSIIAPGFSDIFYANAVKNGLLPAVLEEEDCRRLMAEISASRQPEVAIDLPEQTIRSPAGTVMSFRIGSTHKQALLEGLDEIAQTLSWLADIEAWERREAELEPSSRKARMSACPTEPGTGRIEDYGCP